MLTRILTLIFVIALGLPTQAQLGDYSTQSKKAIKKYELGKAAYDTRRYEDAIKYMDQAIAEDAKFIEPHILKGYIYLDKNEYEPARASMLAAIDINPRFFPNLLFTVGQLEINHGDYVNAKKHMRGFLEFRGSRELEAKAELAIANCDFAMHAMENPVPFKPENMGKAINSKYPEYFPCVTTDDQQFLYTRLIPDDRAHGGIQEDFFMSTRDESGEWQNARHMGVPINSYYNEGAPTLAADGQTLIFTACEVFGEYGAGRKGKGSCDLFYTYKVGQNWKTPVNMGGPINSGHWETQPSFSADGSTLYFVRGIKDGNNRINTGDIYVSKLTDQGYWDTPKKLGPNINTPGDEASVQIHPDGRTLYFSSDGHIGMGGLDIYVSRMGPDGEWGKPVNLGYPINTHGEENSLLVSADGQIAYFASDRDGGFGDLDLYQFDLPEELQPEKVTYMKGTVYDIKTKKKLEAVFELIDLETGKVAVRSYSNPLSGEFLVSLPVNREYALEVSRDGYNFFSENFELKAGTFDKPFLKDVPLVPIEIADAEEGGIVLKNVFFDTDKFELKPKSKVELDKLAQFLKGNPTLKIELGGHTDNQGSKSHNKTLSQNRAKAVMEYLIAAGIDAERLTSAGYGDEKPIATNETVEGRALNRRTEYKITGRIME